jgi:hypothetical protein
VPADLHGDAGCDQYPVMPDRSEILDQLRSMIDRAVSYRGIVCRLAEVLDEPARIVLVPAGPAGTIVEDSYGHPASKGREFLELPVFDDSGGLSDEIRQVALPRQE